MELGVSRERWVWTRGQEAWTVSLRPNVGKKDERYMYTFY